MSAEGSCEICTVALLEDPRAGVTISSMLAYTAFVEAFNKFGMYPLPMRDHFDYAVMFWIEIKC
jgi:hypothetical protein